MSFFLRSQELQSRSGKRNSHASSISDGHSRSGTEIIIPVLNVDRKSLRLRNEITFWIQEAAKLDLSLLICKDEVNWHAIKHGKERLWLGAIHVCVREREREKQK